MKPIELSDLRPTNRIAPSYVSECLDDAMGVINRTYQVLEFLRTLRDWLGLRTVGLTRGGGDEFSLTFESRCEMLWGKWVPVRSWNGGKQRSFCINARSFRPGRSMFVRRMRTLMHSYGVTAINFIDDDESGFSVVIVAGGWFFVARLGFAKIELDAIISSIYESAYRAIYDLLISCGPNATIGNAHDPIPRGKPDLSVFDTDENPCEVGFESF